MQKIVFSPNHNGLNKTALLVKESSFKQSQLQVYYTQPMIDSGIAEESIGAYPLEYPTTKITAKQAKSYLEVLMIELAADDVEVIYVADAEYFKQLTGQAKADVHLGYVLPCKLAGYEYMHVVYGASYASLFHNPAGQLKIDQSIHTLIAFLKGRYLPPGSDLFKRIELIADLNRIKSLLAYLLTKPMISADIETLSLEFRDAGISTIAFAVDTEIAYSFAVNTHLGLGAPVRALLKEFFENYKGKIIWHNIGYDAKILVYNLWMKHPLDYAGMYDGIDVMTANFHDTRLIAYLALNSCSRQQYSLKILAQEFAGNYAEQDIDNALSITPEDLLKYNCVDAMATWYVFNKYYQKMIDDQQNELYEGLFKDSVAYLLEAELTGMVVDMDKVLFAEKELETIRNKQMAILQASKIIQNYNFIVQQKACDAKNATLKVKRVTLADFAHVEFNPASGPQLQELLYNTLALPIIDRTKKKQPATGNKTLTKLLNHTQDPAVLELLNALVELSKVAKILTAFIPIFKNAWLKSDGCYYIHGNFNLGAVVSGRLSSSKPNLQQLPAGSTYGKLIKDCFTAPKGWLMAGADFASLEDKISALTTKDPNKLKVYTDGFDGHCLRAFTYWPDRMPDIVNTLSSINTIKDLYDELRSRSKAPTFALTYQGTFITLIKNCGFSEDEARLVEAKYHELYAVSDQWVQDKLEQASKDGYITAAFGLRVRTPLLEQVVFGSKSMPYEAAAEGRTAGNALGQSYCLLNNRAAVDIRKRLRASPYRLRVRLSSLIHDAIYAYIENHIDVVHWLNTNLPDCMRWQDLPEIMHPTVKLGGELDVFYPSWKYSHTLPNDATKEEIVAITLKPKKK